MLRSSKIAIAILVMAGSAAMASPAMADVTSCIDATNGQRVCTTTPGPPPPPVSLKPPVLGPPALAGDTPWDGHSTLTYPAPRPVAAPAPMYQAPAAPAPRYNAPVAPAPVYQAPVPARVQPAAPAVVSPAVPAAVAVEAPAAPVSAQNDPTPAATPKASPAPVVATVSHNDVPLMLRSVRVSGHSWFMDLLLRLSARH